jgi:CO/xanthine dehydrogenase Mo-binding subunit
MADYTAIGKSILRSDALEKVTGKAKFCTDERLPGMLHGKALRSPYAHARIINIDTSKAAELTGVRGIITGKDAPEKRFGGLRYAFDQYLLARNKVLFAGEAVAAVAADTLDIAEKAIEMIDVKYEELPGIFDVEEAWGSNPPVIVHPDLPIYEQASPIFRPEPDRPNVCNHYQVRHGDVEKGYREADFIMENRFTTARIQHWAPEPHVCIAHIESDGSLTIWTGRQGIYGAKQYFCKTFNLPPSKVRVISSYYVGGAFGSKFMFTVEPITVMLAKKAGRPVRMALTREEVFTSGGSRIPCVINIKDGIKKDGTIIAREIKVLVNIGAYASSGGTLLTRNTSFGAIGTYWIPNFKFDSYGIYTNEPPVCAFRGFASEQAIWAIESHMDMIAEELGIDAVETRKKNLLKEGDINANAEIVHSIGARECLEKVAEFLEWDSKPEKREGGPWRRGKGLALGNKFSTPAASSVSIVKVQEDGTIEVRFSADELGQGANTVMAQIAAEEFSISTDKIKVVWGDTALTPYSTESLSQGTTFNTGNSTRLACLDAKRQLFEIAAEKLGTSSENLDTYEGNIYVKSDPTRSITIAELYAKGYVKNGGEILGRGLWVKPFAPDTPETAQIDPELARKGIGLTSFYTHASEGAEIAVNVETGEVKVERFASACDMGFPINPKMCEQQMEGGTCMGIGSTLWEEMVLDEGKVLNPNLWEYKIPAATNMPNNKNFRIFLAPAHHKNGPYGAKGMGEVPMTPTAPAIANAIYNAIGVRIKELPLTREKVLKAIRVKEKVKV